MITTPRGLPLDGRVEVTTDLTRNVSPGRTGFSQRSLSNPGLAVFDAATNPVPWNRRKGLLIPPLKPLWRN